MEDMLGLLRAAHAGDSAAEDRLYRLLYDDLLRLARRRLRRGRITMVDTGALVHEGWIRLQRAHGITFEARGQFLAYAARVMESVLVDAARRAQSGRRGGDIECVTLDTALGERLCAADEAPLPAVHEALEQLATIDAPLANLVRLRYFAGLDEAELAQTLGITPRMVRRQWEKARAYLVVALKTDSVEAD